MSIGKIISIIGGISVISIGAFFLLPESKNSPDSSASLLSDYQELLDDLNDDNTSSDLGKSCDDGEKFNKEISSLEDRLADLQKRKNDLIEQKNNPDHVPELPEISDDSIIVTESRPGSEPLELSDGDYFSDPRLGSEPLEMSDSEFVPPLPEISEDSIVVTDPRAGSEVPELSDSEFVPSLPEISDDSITVTDPRPGSESLELSDGDYFDNPRLGSEPLEMSDGDYFDEPRLGSEPLEMSDSEFVPPLPEIDEDSIIDPDLAEIENIEKQIKDKINSLKSLCDEEEVISTSCEEACQKYVDCARYADDETEQDMIDAYDGCMEECATWSEKTVICTNKKKIREPLDCRDLSFCILPEYGGPSYQF